MNEYYVYALLDSRKPGKFTYGGLDQCFLYEPFYIGKGSGNRLNAHFTKSSLKEKSYKNSKIKSMIKTNSDIYRVKLVTGLNNNESAQVEIDYISKIGRQSKGPLTNLTDGGDGCLGLLIPKLRKSVDRVCLLTGNVLQTYESITEASDKSNSDISNISACCLGKANSSGGFAWKYSKDEVVSKTEIDLKVKVDYYHIDKGYIKTFDSIGEASFESGISRSIISRLCTMDVKFTSDNNFYFEYNLDKDKFNYKERKQSKYTVPVKLIQADGREIIFMEVKECAEFLGISISYVIYICKGVKGKKLKFDIFYLNNRSYDKIKSDFKSSVYVRKIPINQLDMSTGLIIKEWDSVSTIEKMTGYSASHIIQVCQKRRKTGYGFLWKYKK